MNLEKLTMGAAALGLLVMTVPAMTTPAQALPSAAPALAAGAASDIAKARYQDYPGARASKATKGRSAAYGGASASQKNWKSGKAGSASEAGRQASGSAGRGLAGKTGMAGQGGAQGRSAIQGRSSSQWRSSVGGHGIAPYSDIPHRAMKGGSQKGGSLGAPARPLTARTTGSRAGVARRRPFAAPAAFSLSFLALREQSRDFNAPLTMGADTRTSETSPRRRSGGLPCRRQRRAEQRPLRGPTASGFLGLSALSLCLVGAGAAAGFLLGSRTGVKDALQAAQSIDAQTLAKALDWKPEVSFARVSRRASRDRPPARRGAVDARADRIASPRRGGVARRGAAARAGDGARVRRAAARAARAAARPARECAHRSRRRPARRAQGRDSPGRSSGARRPALTARLISRSFLPACRRFSASPFGGDTQLSYGLAIGRRRIA